MRPAFISEFSLIHHLRTGNEGEVVRRLDRAVQHQRNGVRVLAMARYLFDLHPNYPGYDAALARLEQLARERGLWVELCLLADAQVLMPGFGDRKAYLVDMAAVMSGSWVWVPQICNEPFKNGFASADDAYLLELADAFAASAGHRHFSIGDPVDADEEADVAPMFTEFRQLAGHSKMLVWHGSRKEDDSRWRRWVDHSKGLADVRNEIAHDAAVWHDEPMGAAAGREPGRRDNDPEAHFAAECVSAVIQAGHTYHYISEQSDATPGLDLCSLTRQIPHGPDWRYINAALAGSPVTGFSGWEKVRPCTNGREAWAVAYGRERGSIRWAGEWRPELVYRGDRVELWRATC